jgi:hypothetical protein
VKLDQKGIVEQQVKGNQIVDRFRLIAFFIVSDLQIINDDEKGTIMHGVINKTYMEMFKPLI